MPSGHELDDHILIDLTTTPMMSTTVERGSRIAVLLKNIPNYSWRLPNYSNSIIELEHVRACCLVDNASMVPDNTKQLYYFTVFGFGQTKIQFRARQNSEDPSVAEAPNDIVITLNLLVN